MRLMLSLMLKLMLMLKLKPIRSLKLKLIHSLMLNMMASICLIELNLMSMKQSSSLQMNFVLDMMNKLMNKWIYLI